VFAPISREGALVLNNLLLTTAAATVFLGTLYPLFLDAVGGGKVSVGPPFFRATFVPLMIPLVAALAVGPMLPWKRADLGGVLSRLRGVALITAAIVLVTLYLRSGGPVLALVGVALASWAVLGALAEVAERIGLFRLPPSASLQRARKLPRSAWGTTIAHAGLGLAIAGMVGSTAWSVERIELMRPGETLDLADYQVRLDMVAEVAGPNYTAQQATLSVTRDGAPVVTLRPQKRWYPVTRVATTETAIHTTYVSDIYAALGDADDHGAWTMRLYYHPLVPWIWFGAVVMVAGGLVSLSDRRLRIGAPERRRAAPPVAQPAE
jgi:cytochrome c-type biogenesis protein CcmF